MKLLNIVNTRQEDNVKVNGKVFVVTGGGSGVGRELVGELLSRGAKVAAVDINSQALEETARLSGNNTDRLTTHCVNVADMESVAALPGQVISRHGAVDALINNAGIIHPFVSVNEIGYEMIKKVMEINFGGTLYMTKAFLPHLLTRPEAHITNVSSMGALFSVPGQTIYGASKAGIKILTEGLSSELKDTPIRVMAVFPGGIGSNILDNSGVDTTRRMKQVQKVFKLLTPKKAASMIVSGIEKKRHRLTPGVDSCLTDFFCRLSPYMAPRWIYQVMKFFIQE